LFVRNKWPSPHARE